MDFLRSMDDDSIQFLTAWPKSESVIPCPNIHYLQNIAWGLKVIYCKDTVVHFHFLLICILFGYASMLGMLAENYSDVKDNSEIVNSTILQFIPFTHMLYNIVHSKSFYMHIELLNKTEGVHLKVFFEYCQMVMMSSCPIAFLVGIFNNILGVGNL